MPIGDVGIEPIWYLFMMPPATFRFYSTLKPDGGVFHRRDHAVAKDILARGISTRRAGKQPSGAQLTVGSICVA